MKSAVIAILTTKHTEALAAYGVAYAAYIDAPARYSDEAFDKYLASGYYADGCESALNAAYNKVT